MNSHEMERYCKVITDKLWDTGEADRLFARAAEIIDQVAQGNFDRDNIRTQQFTEELIRQCGGTVRRRLPATAATSASLGTIVNRADDSTDR
jgi:hypothetical protein